MELNAEQLEAVRATGQVSVAAGAGSGKTRVLVERYIAAVKGELTGAKVDPERILMVTFTEKAAAEMEARVRRRLFEEGLADDARRIQGAYISTIHGLCARILRAHPFAAGMDPGFKVLDEARAAALAQQSMSDVLARFAGGAERLDFVNAHGSDPLAADVLDVYSTMRAAGIEEMVLPDVRVDDAASRRVAVREAALALCECGGAGVTADHNRARARACLEWLDSRAAEHIDEDIARDSAIWVHERFKPSKRAYAEQESALAYDAALDALAEAQAGALAADHHALFGELLAGFAIAYQERKRQGGWLDFEDLQLATKRLLKGHPRVRERYRRRFQLVMVDEYQDTNRLQADLLAELDSGELLTVGDGRQSIYGFRHADVSLFVARREEVASADPAKDIGLPRNYRSHAGVIEAVNLICDGPGFWDGTPGHRDGPAGDAAAGGDSAVSAGAHDLGEPLVPDPARAAGDPPEMPRVELALFPSKDPLRGDGDPDARKLEAAWVAGRIRSMLDAGELIYDPRAGQRREVRPSDFAILLRTAGRVAGFERALADQGLPFYAEAGKGYFAEEEVTEVCAYLRVLVQPHDDEALLVALRSPFAGLSFDALWQLRQADHHAPLWEAVLGRAQVGLADEDLVRLDAFVDRTVRARGLLGRLPLARILEWVFVESGYDVASLLRGAGGPRRWANLRKLMDLAIAYEEMEGADPLGFVRFVQTQKELGTREGSAPVAEEATEAVRIMTIHAAKGLEFPVVFLADTGSKLGGGGRDRVIWRLGRGADPSTGEAFAMRLRDAAELGGDGYKTAEFARLADARKADDLAEEARCLYVAMTRAEQRLFISGHLDLDKKAETWTTADIDRIAGALGVTRAPRDDSGRRSLDAVPDPSVVAVTVVRLDAVAGEPRAAGLAAGVAEDQPAPKQRLEGALAEIAGAPAPFEPSRPPRTIARTSFSALADFAVCPYRYRLTRIAGLGEIDAPPRRPGGAEPGNPRPKGPARTKTDADPRTLGTVVHALLERADLSGPPPDREAIAAALAGSLAGAPAGDGDAAADETARSATLDRAAALIEAFWVSPTVGRLREAQQAGARIARELPFAVAVGETVLGGVIDAAVLPSDGEPARIVDYKTNRLEATSPAELFETRYNEQAEAYALALLAAGHRAVEVEVVFLEAADSPVVRTFTSKDAGALKARIAARLQALAEGPYRPRDAYDPDACSGCPGLAGLCPV